MRQKTAKNQWNCIVLNFNQIKASLFHYLHYLQRFWRHLIHEMLMSTKQIESNPDWEGQKSKVMHEIVSAKLQQCQSLKEALQDSGSQILVSPKQGDIFWGTGLNLNLTCQTNPNAWPGKNMYGSVLMSLRDQVGNVDGNVNCTQGNTPDDQRRYKTRSSNSAGKAKSPREKIQNFFKPNPKK